MKRDSSLRGFRRVIGHLSLVLTATTSSLILPTQQGLAQVIQEQLSKALLAEATCVEIGGVDSIDILIETARDGDTQLVRTLMDCGVPVNNRGLWVQTLANEDTMELMAQPIHAASWNGHAEIVQMLLDAGAGVDMLDEWGFTPLMTAAEVGDKQIVILLLEAGADVDRATRCTYCMNETALLIAVQYGHVAVVSELLEAGADKSIELSDGRNALFLARMTGNQQIIQMLEDD